MTFIAKKFLMGILIIRLFDDEVNTQGNLRVMPYRVAAENTS